jgi:hypothetical protein
MAEARCAIEGMPDGALKQQLLNALNTGRIQGQIFRWPQ